MNFRLNLTVFATLLGLSIPIMAIADDDSTCSPGEVARAFFATRGLEALPNYTEGPGARVQRQHPDTLIYGHTKFIRQSEGGFALCAYSNHVGWVAIYGDKTDLPGELDATCKNLECENLPRWRLEYTESNPEQDRRGQEQMYVCVENKKGVAHPSLGCTFNKVKRD